VLPRDLAQHLADEVGLARAGLTSDQEVLRLQLGRNRHVSNTDRFPVSLRHSAHKGDTEESAAARTLDRSLQLTALDQLEPADMMGVGAFPSQQRNRRQRHQRGTGQTPGRVMDYPFAERVLVEMPAVKKRV